MDDNPKQQPAQRARPSPNTFLFDSNIDMKYEVEFFTIDAVELKLSSLLNRKDGCDINVTPNTIKINASTWTMVNFSFK